MMTEIERAELLRLRDFVSCYTYCPCCAEDKKCMEECTFADDCPDDARTMRAARYARYAGDGDVDAPDVGA